MLQTWVSNISSFVQASLLGHHRSKLSSSVASDTLSWQLSCARQPGKAVPMQRLIWGSLWRFELLAWAAWFEVSFVLFWSTPAALRSCCAPGSAGDVAAAPHPGHSDP